MVERLFKKFFSALVDTASKKSGPDHSVTDHTCPVNAQGSDGETHTLVTLGGKTPLELAMGRDQEISWT